MHIVFVWRQKHQCCPPDWSSAKGFQRLEVCTLAGNLLTGALPDWSAGSTLKHLGLQGNRFTGMHSCPLVPYDSIAPILTS